jgi:hypothetical protein
MCRLNQSICLVSSIQILSFRHLTCKNLFYVRSNSFDRCSISFDRCSNSFYIRVNSFDRSSNSFYVRVNSFDRSSNSFDRSSNSFCVCSNSFDRCKNTNYTCSIPKTGREVSKPSRLFSKIICQLRKAGRTFLSPWLVLCTLTRSLACTVGLLRQRSTSHTVLRPALCR